MESGGEISAIPFRHREPRSGASPGEGAAGQPMPRRSTASRLVGRRRNDREAFGGDLRSYGVWRVMPSLRMRETSVLRFIPSRTAAPPGPVGRGAADRLREPLGVFQDEVADQERDVNVGLPHGGMFRR